MALEDALKAHAASLDENTKALEKHIKALDRNTNTTLEIRKPAEQAAPAETSKAKADTKQQAKSPIPREDVVKALRSHGAVEGKESAIAILKALGADTVSDLDPDKYAEAIDRADHPEKYATA